jgi:hypothetical protein
MPRTVFDSTPEIGFPPPEIVIYNKLSAPLLFARAVSNARDCALLAVHISVTDPLREIEVVDDINQKKRRLMFVRCSAVQINIFFRHELSRKHQAFYTQNLGYAVE